MTQVKKAILPIGGWATRFLPITKSIPKSMLPVLDKPIIHYAVKEATDAGLTEIILVTGSNSETVVNYFKDSPELEVHLAQAGNIAALDQVRATTRMAEITAIPATYWNGMPGLGSAIMNARQLIGDEPFAVILPNDLILASTPCMTSLVQIYNASSSVVIAAHQVTPDSIPTYGNIAIGDASHRTIKGDAFIPQRVFGVQKLIQRPSPHQRLSELAIIGRYVLTPDIFPILEHLEAGYGGELQLTDALDKLRAEGATVLAYQFDGEYLDTRSKAGYLRAMLEYARRDPELSAEVYQLCHDIAQERNG